MTVGPPHLRPAHCHIRFREADELGAAVSRIHPLEETAAGIPPKAEQPTPPVQWAATAR